MVTQKGGTGRLAQVEGYVVAGKTGTAHKTKGTSGYSSDHVSASFVGFVPADQPRLVIYINVDEPQIKHYGGQVAAPIFSSIARETLPFLGVPASKKQGLSKGASLGSSNRYRSEPVLPTRMEYTPWWSKDRFITNAPDDVIVPDLTGKDLSTALKEVAALNLELKIQGSGVIVKQTPESGELIPPNRLVEIHLERPSILVHRRTP
jgi:cell division protein FtsI (penicillin-binding protein 3)